MIQKVFKNKKAFTLVETIIVIVIIWVLMMWTTIYFGWSNEKRKIIEAQWCLNTILWELNNYTFYAMTSKGLRTSSDVITPNFYRITLDGDSTLKLGYSMNDSDGMTEFKTLNTSNTCRQNNSNLKFARNVWDNTDNISGLKMNKWFSPVSLNENRVFYLKWDTNKYLTWDIFVTLCLDNTCSGQSMKQFAKRTFDWRTQIISLVNCAFYNDDNTCKSWENCKVYNDTDVTACDQY